MKTFSLRLWIPVIVFLLTSLLIVGMSFYQTAVQTNNLKQQKIAEVKYLMIRLQRLSQEAVNHQHLHIIEQEISSLGIKTEIDALALINPEGRVKYANRYAWKTKMAVEAIAEINPAYIAATSKQMNPIVEFSKTTQAIYAYFPVSFSSEQGQLRSFSHGVLYLNYNLSYPLKTIWYEVLVESGGLWLNCLLLMLLLMLILSYFVNRPINHLTTVMESFSGDELIQSKLTGNSELAALGQTFNQLSARLVVTQQRLSKQMDLYEILSATNQLIIRSDSHQYLFDEICQITVNKNRFLLAWIGLVNNKTKRVEVLAKSGKATAYLDDIFISTNQNIPEGQGTTAIAIRENRHIVNSHFLSDEQNIPWHQAAEQEGIKASAAFPIVKFGQVIGAFNIYADSDGYFTDEVVSLLDEMTKDISFALENFHTKELKRQAEINLLEKEKKLSVTLDAIGDGVIVIDVSGNVIRLNPVAESLTGWQAKEAIGRAFDDIFHIINTTTRKVIKNPIHKVLQEQRVAGLANHTTLISKEGQEYQISDSAAPIFDDGNNIIGVVLVFQDVSEQYTTIEALKISEMRFHDVINASESYIWEIDTEGVYTYLTEKVEEIKGYKISELLGHKPFEFMLEEDVEPTLKIVKEAIDNKGRFELSHRNISSEGKPLWEEVKGQVVTNKHGEVIGLRGVGVGINKRKRDEAEIQRLAYYDPLTALPNRRMITDRLADEIAAAKRHGKFGALLFLDLDNFKNLNDSLGHDLGDELLIQIAKRIKGQLRKEDIAARLGGDEFIVLLTNLSLDINITIGKARKVTEKLLDELREPYQLNDYHYHNSSSIGITLFPINGEDATTVFKQADIALYRAKDNGKNNFQFYRPEMQETAYKRLEIEKDLRIALSEGQLELYYQPQVNQAKNLIGAEALLRWKHPEKGFIPPDQFIPVAEEASLIIEIGLWIFRQGFYQVKKWMDAGLLNAGQHISINVSPKQFKQKDFVQQIGQIIQETGINAQSVILELTEGTFLDDVEDTIEKMLHLRGLGFIFSIDDFGTGYSSLSYLKRLPINELKIDKAFIDELDIDSDDQVIVNTIIGMAKHLKFSVIAEGVETEQQFKFLKQHGCFNYQGYFFSKPLDKETFEEYMRQNN
ncbi:MAG: EAL domain-containing protein [Methylococcaceae bacterium]|nr:EAL domain-containing protein [Methylococcaceae bacterium]